MNNHYIFRVFAKHNSFVKKYLYVLLTGLLISALPSASTLAQVNIIDPNAANAPDLNKCSGAPNLEIVLQFGSNGPNATVSLPLPPGVQYVPGSVMLVSQTGGLAIAQTSAAPSSPLFTITAGDGTINMGNEIRFKYKVKGDCVIAPGTLIFPVNVTYNAIASAGEVLADVLEADLNLTSHPLTTATIGVPVTVPILIQNGGLGEIDSLDFVITEMGMTTTQVVVNGIPSTLISNLAGVRRYRIYSNALPGGKLNNPETITVLRTVIVQSCIFSSNYATNWGCNGTLCQTPEPFGPGEFVLTSGSPNVQITSTLVSASNSCTNAIIDLTYTNNGSGPANAAAAFNMIFKAGMNTPTGWSAPNWSTVSVTMNGNPVVFTGGSSGTGISFNANQFASDPDGAGGLADVDLDGKFDDLPKDAFITIRVTLKYSCPTACPAPNETANLVSGAMYSDQCAAMQNSIGPGGFLFSNSAIGTPVVYTPSTVSDGETFNAEICLSRTFDGAGMNCPSNKIKFAITLPAAVTATGVGSINGLPAVVTTVGNIATVEGAFLSGMGMCISIEMTYACSADPINFAYEVTYQCDVACACIQKWACGTFSMTSSGCLESAACPDCPPCPDGGLTISALEVERTTLGYTDHTGTTRITDPSTLPALSLLKAMPCDTVKFTMSSAMNGGDLGTASFDNAYLEVSYDRLAGNNLLGYGTGTYRYYDASTGNYTSGALPAPTNTVIAGRHVYIWNFNAILPSGMMEPGDSIFAYPRFVVLNNTALNIVPTKPPNAVASFFNLASALDNPLPGGSPRFSCGSFSPEFYLHTNKPQPLPVAGGRAGCGSYPVAGALNNEVTLLFDEYPNEIRPVEIVKSVKVQILNGDSYDPSVQPVLTVYGSTPDDPWYTPGTFNLPAPTIAGNMLTWTNPGNWPVSDMAGTNPALTGYAIQFSLKNSGCINAADGTLKTTWNYDNFGYAIPACRQNVVTLALTGTVGGGAPQHTLSNFTGTISGTKRIECFQVEVKNATLGRESGYIWLALEDNLSPMDVVSVKYLGNPLPLISYANGKWIKLATSFPGGFSMLLDICVKYTDCTDNLLTLKQGWDCNAYPTNPTTYTCPVTQTTLRILPVMPRVQGDFLATSPLPAMMCEDFVFNFRMNSSQKADLFEPAVKVVLPPFMFLQGDVEIEYPINSGNWQIATPAINGQEILVDLTNHTGIDDTLPGTINADVLNFPLGEDRQAAVRFTVRTTCDYLSGDRILFQPLGKAACGGSADGSGASFLSPRIRIFGAEPTYEGTFSMNLGSPDNLYGCYAQALDITVQLADVDVVDNLAAFTGSADTIFITLPGVLDMVPGSFVCTTIPAANCPTFVDQTIDVDGRRVLKFVLPPNISIPNGGVVPLVFSVMLQPQQEIACTIEDQIKGYIIAVYENIFCPEGEGYFCPIVRAIAGEGATPVVLKKMELDLEDFFIACSLNGQIQYTAKIRVLNLPLAADSSFVVEIYCLDALGQPLFLVETKTITGLKAVGSLTTITGTFAGCDPQNGVLIKISLQTAAGNFQCHCAPIEQVSNNLPKCPSVIVSTFDNEICPYENAMVTATLSGATSGGTWTSSGTGIFANNTALTTTYTPSTADKAAGLVTLTFTTNDLTGTCAPGVASVLITIRPLPVVAPATLTVCASTLGGNSGVFNLTLADNLVDPQDVNAVTYHATQANANTGTSPLSSPYTANNNTTIYARVVNATTGCYNTTTVLLKVSPLPTAAPASLSVCERPPFGSGVGLFNLNLATPTVNNGSGLTVTYHATLADAQADANALSNPHTANNGTIVFARVEINATGCYSTSQVTLNVLPSPRTYTHTLKVCAMGVGIIMAEFDLTQANTWVTTNTAAGPVPAGLAVTYHNSYTDAESDINPLASPFMSVTANVWVRVENTATGCYSIDIVQLVVLPRPIVVILKTDESCPTAANGTATAIPTSGQVNFTYDWSNDGPENPDNDLAALTGLVAGTYTVTLTDGNGCTSSTTTTIAQVSTICGSIGLAKRAVQTVLNADGSALVTYEFNLENLGGFNLDNITLIDNLTTTFPGTCTVLVTSLTSDDFIVNPAYNGTGNNNMLAINNDLPAGDKGAVLLTILVNNCGNPGPFINTASTSGTPPFGPVVNDVSDDGSEPDSNDNDFAGDPGEDTPTPVSFAPNPVIGVAKRNVKTELLPDGSANVTFEFNLENFGNVNLNALTLTDNLATAFPASCAVTVMSLTSDDFIVNSAFTGTGNNNMLAAGNDLPVGDKGAVLLTINVANCGAAQTSFVNTATATGTSPGGTTVTDNSVNGSDPDGSDGDNNPDEASNTPVSFVQNPVLGVAKRNVKTELLADGSANVTFEFNLENFGNVNLNNLTLTDNLATAFPASCAVSVMSLTSDDFIVNPSFTGTGNNNMLAAGNDLPVGDKGAVLLTINVANCGAGQTSFVNTATATGTSPGGTTVTDNSVNGSDPDGTDGDNNPDESSNTPISFTQNPVLGVAKRNVQTVLNADGSANVTFEFNLENFGNVNLSDLKLRDNLSNAFPSTCVVSVLSLTSDDFIVNAGYTGIGNNNMLAAGNDLPVGDKGAVLLMINVANCGAAQTSFVNNATAMGTSPGGTTVTDNSINGSDPDGNDGDNNPDEESGTPVSFIQNPLLGVAKRNVKTELLPDGSANVTFEFNLENFGNVNLNALTLTDDLAAAFPASCAVSVMSLTSDDFIVNPLFTGTGNNNMLAAGNDLPVGDKGAVLLTINVANCAAAQTSFVNTATATGTSPGGTTVTDTSVNGADPDGTDGDNNPDEESGTPVSFTQNPVLGVAKRNVKTELLPDGSANVTFEFNLENFGNVNLNALTLTDNLATTFPASCSVSVMSLTSDDFIVNPLFTGIGNNNMLAAGNDLPVGDKGAVLLTVNVANCGAAQTSFVNNATATGTSPGGTTVTDNSVNGSDPDGTDGDNNPDEESGTPVSFTQNPVLGVAKRNVQTVLNADGSANVTFEFNLENFGNVNLNNLTLIDNLATAFPASCVVTVTSLTSDDFIVNPSFTGTGNNNMLAAGNDLPVGDKGAVLLTVNVVNCGAAQTAFVNSATATGTSPGGTTVTDNSVNGSDPDGTDGDNNPDETSGTPVSFTQNPVLGVAKRNVKTELLPDGSANVTFEFNLENFGNVNLNNLTLIDNLATTFPASCAVTVMSLTSDDFIVNPAFNGTGNNNMLAAGNDLPVGDKGAVLLTVNVANCGAAQTSFVNNATATGTSPGGTTVTDNSVNGSDPDGTDGDNNPDESSNTPVSFTQNPVLGVAKRNVQTVLNADGSANVTFEFNLENFGNVNLNALTLTDNLATAFPASCAVTVLSLTSDDFIVNPSFTGTGNNNMLAAGNDLPVGDKGAVLLTINVANCAAAQTSFVNTATATGTSPGGTTVTDNSVNGSDPDGTDGDNNPDETSGTPISFTQNPVLGVAKRNVKTELLPDGSANVTFEFNLENFGNVNLNALTLTDNLGTTFPASCAVSVMSLTSDDFIVNPLFTGIGNNNMLAAGNDLPVGDKGAVLLTVNVANCGAAQTSFVNNATATGTSPGGTTVTDNSVNGSDPDGTDGDNNPDEESGTPVSFTQNPVLGVAKRNVQTVLNADGSANVTFEFNLENFGNVNLSDLKLRDDLASTFPASCAVTVLSLTSDDFIVNPSFDGVGTNNLLDQGNDLPVGDKGAVLLTINVANCASNQTAFINTARAIGTSPGGTTVTDNSVNGSDPDGTDGDNNPDETSGTPVSFTQNPVLGVAKRNVQTVLNADGSANVTFEFNLENFGNVNLYNLTLTDNLATTFPASCVVSVASLTSDDFNVNASFNGTGNNNLLAAGNYIPVGQKGALLLTVNVANCASNQTSFVNTAIATGVSPGGTTVTDNSVNGSDADGTDGDNNPDEASGTPVSFTQNPVLGVAKRNVKTELLADGSANVTFEFNLENFGNVNLNNLTLTDNLAATFPASCSVSVMSLTSDDFNVNASFNGTGNNNLLAAGNDLPVGDKGAVLLTINVANCASSQTSFVNTATATGTSPGGTTVTDKSVNGSDPDGTDGDNNPDEESGTPISFMQNPVLGVAKRNVQTVLNADGSANVTFEFNLENFGNVNLNNLTLTDNLAITFPASCSVTVMSLTSDDFIVNPSFTGTGNNNMLAAGNDLPVGDKGAVLLTVNVANCGFSQTSFINTATVTGTSPGGTTVTDKSVNGSDPDGTDGDNNPDEESGTPISFVQNPILGVAKRNVQTVLNANGSADVTFEFNLENFGNVNLNNLTLIDNLAATFPATCSVTVLSLTSDDFIVNASFNGTGNNNLLAAGNDIPVGDKGAVLLTINVAGCGTSQTMFTNTATATGTAPDGSTTTDVSEDGSDPDPNGNGNPGDFGENTPTPVSFMEKPVLGLTKRVSNGPVLLPDNSYELRYEIKVFNLGNVDLSNLSVIENLASTFTGATSWQLIGIESEEFEVNTSYNGNGINELLAAGNTLTVGNEGAIYITVRVSPGTDDNSYDNTVTGSATSPGGMVVTDISDDGSDPDTDNDGNPNEPGENDPTPVELPCFIGIICPAVVSPIVVDNDLEWCNAMVNFPPAVPIICAGASTPLIEFQLSGVGAENTPNGVWIIGQPSGLRYRVGTTTVRIRARLGAINDEETLISTECVFDITVLDKQAPKIQCPGGIYQFGTNAACTYIATAAMNASATDNCAVFGATPPNQLLTLTYNLTGATMGTGTSLAGVAFNLGNTIIVWTASDNALPTPNKVTCSYTIVVSDNDKPVITNCPINRTVNTSVNGLGDCTATVPNLIPEVVATDNCTAAASLIITQVPAAGTIFGAQHGDQTTVTITVTDAAGNAITCLVVLTIVDNEPPIFTNCPTTMLMFGTDPDQCSAKVNWLAPTADDNCGGAVSILQTAGPLPGAIVSATCPPAPTTITYKATDARSLMSTCNFTILVLDTEKPEFDADIIMPNDTTVNCHQVPSNCVYHGPLICTPLTNNDVNDNCTAPANLVVTYKEVSTQNPNPAVCGHYKYNLTRTWTVKDCAGNALVHTQLIAVQDTTRPVALCKNATVSLDKTGKYILDPQTVNNGSFDNCAAFPNLTFSVSPNQFTCANLGPNLVTLTVTDPCGNASTCQATVTVNDGIAPCTPEFDVETTCMGMNAMGNATTLEDGQFMDLITIKSLAMQTWKLTVNVTNNGMGLYSISSPVPPASPVQLPVGTLFTVGTADGINNDGDAATDEADEMIYYTLKALHVDCRGYDITVSNQGGIGMGLAATTTSIQNKACYPNPYFSSLLDAPFCLGTPPFDILVAEYNNAAGSVVPGSIMVNGVPTTVFDAAALGLGFHTVMATFDAGAATTNLIINGVQIGGSMADAVADPGCKQKITQIVQVLDTPNTLICNDLVHVSMDEDCKVTVLVDDVLEGTYYCFDDYLVEIDKTLPFGNGPWVMAMFDASDIGKTYFYHVTQTVGGANICWGEIKIEDKLAPKLDCPDDITIACSESTSAFHTGNVVVKDCSATTTVIDDQIVDNGECGNPRQIITRTFIVTDAWGNQSICTQVITVIPFDLDDVIFPAEITVNCETAYLNPNATHPNITGYPSINGASIGGGGLCSASIGYTDVRLDICVGSYEIYRTWLIANTCLPAGPDNPISAVQRIRVKDLDGPQFICPPAATVSADPFTCCATAALPSMVVSEGCSHINDLEAKVTGVDPINGNIITFTVPGHLEDFLGNNWWNPDTLAVFSYTQCMPLGEYTVQYKAQDQCNNISYCNFVLTVADLVPPTVSCDQVTQVALNVDGMAVIPASVLNDNSTDNCCIDKFEVARMNNNSCSGTSLGSSVKFCCSDIGDTILVVFRAFDCHGNSNDCMVSVLVEDKIKPTCTAPAQVTVNCENFDPSLWVYGKADVTDNCCLDTTKVYQGQVGLSHSVNYSLFDTVCNKGTITRTFRAFDCGGNSSSCTQRVIVTYLQDYFVKFPNDAIVTTCDGTGVYGEPIFFGEDCELLGVTFADDIFTVVPDACFKIERTWQIINWCTFNPNLPVLSVPNPNPNAITNHITNLAGPTVSACGTLPPWKSTVVKINPSDPLPGTDYCTLWGDTNGDGHNEEANGYSYKQIIKIIDGQAPTGTYVVPDCSNQNWFTANRGDLWNESYWWDNGLQLHDLCEEPTDLCITATDACSGSNVNIEYLLFLDLDGNGTMETVINSVNTGIAGYGWNNVQYNNASNPNFGGGTPRAFDERPVPGNQKWGFSIQETVVGNNKTACVRWNTQQQQNTYVTPELPHGTHKIKWLISDGCGNNKEYEYTFTVKDCKAPTVVCINGLSVNIMPTGMIQLWASDFLQYTEDNCTPNPLKISIRKCGIGTGFPVDAFGNPILQVTFDCTELGTQCVELWAIDAAGNADYCETYVIIQDNLGNCPNADRINVTGALKTEMAEGVEEGIVSIDGTSTFAPPYSYFDLSDTLGVYAVTNNVPLAATFVIAPEKDDNPLNGVTTYDLALISKHILGIEPLNSPYKMIAADANKSGSITTFDIVEIRKLILGIYTELPNNTSWRFVDKTFQFPNMNNPFQTLFPETISVADAMTTQWGEDFVGVKIGDVNNTSIANATMQAEDRTTGTAIFDIEERTVKAGETFEVTFKSAQALKGFQFTMLLDGLEAIGVRESDQVSASNFGLVFGNSATVSIDGAQDFTLQFRAMKSGKLSEMLGVSGSITRAEAYLPAEALAKEGQVNDPMTQNDPMSQNDAMTQNDAMMRLGVAFRFGGKTISGVGFELYQNQPNPFVNRTFVGFYLPEAAEATLSIFDETGRVVYQQKGQFAKGENSISLDARLVIPQGTGLLYYKLETATDSATKKMIQAK